MMLQGVPSAELVEHCEKYLYLYEDGHFCVHTDRLNNMEKALAFDYLYYKLRKQAQADKESFFHPTIFLTMVSSLVLKLMRTAADPLGMQAYEQTMNEALSKIRKVHKWFEAGQPPDDENLVNEMVEVMNSNQERMAPVMEMMNKMINDRRGTNSQN